MGLRDEDKAKKKYRGRSHERSDKRGLDPSGSIHRWPAAMLAATLVLELTLFSFEAASAKTAREIDVSVDVALEEFENRSQEGRNSWRSAREFS